MTVTTSTAGREAPTNEPESASGPSETPREPSSSGSETSLRTEADKAREVHRLLSGELEDDQPEEDDGAAPLADQPDEDQAGSEEAGSKENANVQKISELSPQAIAKRLDIPVEDVYGMQITTGDGEKVSLGSLKDAWQDRQEAARETAKREAGLDQRESAILANQRLWSKVAGDLAGKLSPETMNGLREQAQQMERQERQRMLQAMPELNDEASFANWREKLVTVLGGYGFRPAEMVITDHRMLLIMRDLMRTNERLAKLMSYSPSKEPPKAAQTQGRSTPSNSKALAKRARNGTDSDKVAAVSALLGK
jgi:hypothetical protein